MPNPLSPLPLSLMGTMLSQIPGLNPAIQGGNEKDAALAELMQGMQASQGAASQAQGQYQQAAEAPVTPPGDIASFTSTLASIISRRPEFEKNRRADMLQKRSDNLQALRDNYESLSKKAMELDPIAALKYQQKVETAHKAWDAVQEQLKFAREGTQKEAEQNRTLAGQKSILADQIKGRLSEIHAQGEEQRLTDKLKMSGSVEDLNLAFQSSVKTTQAGNKFLDAGELTGKDKGLAFRWAAANGYPMVGKQGVDKLQRIDIARSNIANMKAQIETLLPKDPAGRFDPRLPLSKIFQTPGGGALRASFNTFRIAAIEQLTALAGGMGSGLRINQAEILTAIRNDIPNVNPKFGPVDTYETAQQKMENVLNMLSNTEDPIVQDDWRRLKSTLGNNVAAADTARAPSPTNKVRMSDVNGKPWDLDASEVADAVANGWKRSK